MKPLRSSWSRVRKGSRLVTLNVNDVRPVQDSDLIAASRLNRMT